MYKLLRQHESRDTSANAYATSEREAMLHGKLVVRFLVSQGLDYLEFFRTDRIAAQIEQF